jgi:hypothetical protein
MVGYEPPTHSTEVDVSFFSPLVELPLEILAYIFSLLDPIPYHVTIASLYTAFLSLSILHLLY